MKEIKVRTLGDYHETVSRHHNEWSRWYYRGHRRPNYKLRPKIAREPFASRIASETMMFEKWKRFAVAYVTAPSRELSEWDWLAIAQHHGLATRLLDWTFNPLAAAFFAVVSSNGKVDESDDSVVYAHYTATNFIDTKKRPNPFLCKGIHRVAPSSVAPRIGRQGGIFTIHGPPNYGLDDHLPKYDKLEKIVIDKSCKKNFAIQLSHYGINRLSLFPDLDGLSAHINWSFTYLRYK